MLCDLVPRLVDPEMSLKHQQECPLQACPRGKKLRLWAAKNHQEAAQSLTAILCNEDEAHEKLGLRAEPELTQDEVRLPQL